MIAWY